jgi:hypothetical protein
MNRIIFKDEQINSVFLKQGYVKLPFLDKTTIEEIHSFYLDNQPKLNNTGFHSTHFNNDRAYKKLVHQFIKDSFSNVTKHLFEGYKIVFCNFMVKEPGDNSRMPLHLDWTYVDEKNYVSLAIWCTLTDTNEVNGTLGVVPYSHQFESNLRGPKIESPFHHYNEELIARSGKLINLKAGEGVVYNHKMMHFSPPNLSNHTRIAINVVLVPEDVTINHYCVLDDPTKIHCYTKVDEAFFINYDAFESPSDQYPKKLIDNPFIKWDRTFINKYLPEFPLEFVTSKKNILYRLKAFFKLK